MGRRSVAREGRKLGQPHAPAVGARPAEDILDHELGLDAALPALGDRLEDEIDHRIAVDERVDLRDAEHDGRNARGAIGRHEPHMVARLAHHGTIAHGDTASSEQGHFVALPEWLEHADLANGVDIKFREAHRRRHLAAVFEILPREFREHRIEPFAQRIEIFRDTRHAHRTGMTAKTNEQVRALLDRLEEVHVTHGATGAAGNASSIENRRAGTW